MEKAKTVEEKTVDKDGTVRYWRNGLLHRGGDQPAVIWADCRRSWYVDGVFIKLST